MFSQTIERSKAVRGGSRPKISFRLWKALIIAVAVAIVVSAIPSPLSSLSGLLSGSAQDTHGYISRASAFVAFGLIWLSMLAGLGITSKLSRIWPSMPASFALHRFSALLGIGFGVIHALTLLGSPYINYGMGQIIIPFTVAATCPRGLVSASWRSICWR